jgi:rod shape-determining protein MreD
MIFEKIIILAGIIMVHIINGSNLFDFGPEIKPDFMILYVLFFSLRKGEMSGLWIGFIGGLLTDAGLGGEEGIDGRIYYKIGIHALSYSLTGYLLGKFGRSIYNENYLSITIYALLVSVIMRAMTYFLFNFFFYPNLNYSLLISSIYNAAIAPISFFIFSWIFKLQPSEVIR